MTTQTAVAVTRCEPALLGHAVVEIDGSAGTGPETALRARDGAPGPRRRAHFILTARHPDHLQRAAAELDAPSTAAFEATDPDATDPDALRPVLR